MNRDGRNGKGLKRRDLLLGGASLAAASTLPATAIIGSAQAQPESAAHQPGQRGPNILLIMSDGMRSAPRW
jgi:hypothetical protein